MMSFIHCFPQKSKICHRIDPDPSEGAHDKEKLYLVSQNSPKYAILRSRNKKLPLPGPFSGGEGSE